MTAHSTKHIKTWTRTYSGYMVVATALNLWCRDVTSLFQMTNKEQLIHRYDNG